MPAPPFRGDMVAARPPPIVLRFWRCFTRAGPSRLPPTTGVEDHARTDGLRGIASVRPVRENAMVVQSLPGEVWVIAAPVRLFGVADRADRPIDFINEHLGHERLPKERERALACLAAAGEQAWVIGRLQERGESAGVVYLD